MEQRKIKIIIEKSGDYSLEAMEGFSGTSCVEKTQQLELVLGGTMTAEGKKQSYYDTDPYDPVTLKL